MPRRVAVADPPYLGRAARYYSASGWSFGTKERKRRPDVEHHDDAELWDRVSTWAALIRQLNDFDAWALALSSDSLRHILPLCPVQTRIAAWHVSNYPPGSAGVVSSWEPVLLRGYATSGPVVKDALLSAAPRRDFIGSKPDSWWRWILAMLDVDDADEVVDLFPGSHGGSQLIAQRVLL